MRRRPAGPRYVGDRAGGDLQLGAPSPCSVPGTTFSSPGPRGPTGRRLETAVAARIAATVAGLLLVAGCASGMQSTVHEAAKRFSTAVSSGDAAAACALLAPTTRQELERTEQAACPEALASVGLPRVLETAGVQRFGRQGSVVLTGPEGERDTYFLSKHGSTWLVSAAGCEPQGELPYSCDVEGL